LTLESLNLVTREERRDSRREKVENGREICGGWKGSYEAREV
jgi:hypothetical protein